MNALHASATGQALALAGIMAFALAGCGEDTATKPGTGGGTTTSGTTSSGTTTGSTATHETYGTASGKAAAAPADNSGKNARDDGSTLTPLDQGMSKEDTAITQAVRQALVADKDLSVNAHNVKIIARDGSVTLRGPVATEAERTRVVDLAQKAAGVRVVDNQLEVAAK